MTLPYSNLSQHRTKLYGIAALLIILFHSNSLQWKPLELFKYGYIGVDVFLFIGSLFCFVIKCLLMEREIFFWVLNILLLLFSSFLVLERLILYLLRLLLKVPLCLKEFEWPGFVWIVFDFLGKDSDINLKQTMEYQEFSKFDWKTSEFLLRNIIQMKKQSYKQVFDFLKKINKI